MTHNLKRRNFIKTSAMGAAAAGFMAAASGCGETKPELGQYFIHHVFFWLKEPVTAEVRDKFENSLRILATVETITDHHIGIPAPTSREVIDSSYTYSMLTTFKNKEDQDIYQGHPIHLQFIEDCQDLWERVLVYDTVSIR